MRRLFEHPTVRTHAPQLIKFAVTGGLGTIVDMTTLTTLTRVFSVSPEVGFLISATTGAIFVFFVNKFFTFKNRDRFLPQLLKHATVYVPAIIANFALSTLLFWLGVHDLLAKLIAIGVIAIANYLLSHHYVFRKRD